MTSKAKRIFKSNFLKGVNFYHFIGLFLLLWGSFLPHKKIFESSYVTFSGNVIQLVGAIAFFYELVKAIILRRKRREKNDEE